MKIFKIHLEFFLQNPSDKEVGIVHDYVMKRIVNHETYQKYGTTVEVQKKNNGPISIEKANELFADIEDYSSVFHEVKKKLKNHEYRHYADIIQKNQQEIKQEILAKLQNEDYSQYNELDSITLFVHFNNELPNNESVEFLDDFKSLAEVYPTRYRFLSWMRVEWVDENSKKKSNSIEDRLMYIYSQMRDAIREADMPGGDLIMLQYPFKDYTFDVIDALRGRA